AAVSRCSSPLIFALLRPARNDGLAKFFGHPGHFNIALTLIWPSLMAIVMLSVPQAFALLSGALVATLAIAALAHRYLGGYTGDVLGAGISLSFITSLIAIRLTS
ncbi:MAG: adenosylcobinamide-GDP ribazoletransferase, partial [Pseudomonadota bacterium]